MFLGSDKQWQLFCRR